MNIITLTQQLTERYAIQADYPWQKFPDYAVFRHPHNKKWFCLLAKVPANKLGLPEQTICDIVNVKARPELIGALRTLPNILPAYHMNKEHWLTILLAHSSDEEIFRLIDDSFQLTQ